eukprot:SAG31_NODE_2191_length_6228_cov_2.962806_4_plen_164_part_00
MFSPRFRVAFNLLSSVHVAAWSFSIKVSRIPNLDGIVEVSPRVVSGDVAIRRSPGRLSGGFSHWTTITAGGVTEAMVSAITNDGVDEAKTSAILDKIDAFVKEAGGTSLAHDGVFNNAYVLAATGDTEASRARIAEFNKNFTAWYGAVRTPSRCSSHSAILQC